MMQTSRTLSGTIISKTKRSFSALKGVSVIDLNNFMKQKGDYKEDCKAVAKAFEETGCLVVRDPRVNQNHNEEFLNMMESYFENRSSRFYKGETNLEDFYPQLGYQTGATPEGVEKARDHKDLLEKLKGEDKAKTPSPPPHDAKWRYFWRIGERPAHLKNKIIDPPRHIPKDVPQFETKMDTWGNLMINCVNTVSEMMALGLGLDQSTFTSRLQNGPHLLAPTGSDLQRYDLGTIFAGFHYDLNYITIHSKSRFPGLFVWLRDGSKRTVVVPDGCLLLQSGKQLEILTGGHIKAGFHEVVYTEQTKAAMEKAKREGKSTWRVSSTLFSHIRQDVMLEPLNKFSNAQNKMMYQPMTAEEQVEEEIRAINLYH